VNEPRQQNPGHLVVTRAEGQAVHIGPDITVTLVWCRSGQAQLAITAPKTVKVLRAELGRPAEVPHERV